MAVWSGLGINYGQDTSNSVYNTTQVEADFTLLRNVGISKLRIAMPGYSSASITNCQDMVTRALAHGFYVAWGVGSGQAFPNLTATIWAAMKTYIIGTLAPWAQAHGLSELLLGNEEELHLDGTTLTATTLRSDIRGMVTTVKSGGYTGLVGYTTSPLATYRTPWITEGIGSLDLIGWNSYDTFANFDSRNGTVFTAFGSKTYISEFGSLGGGYPDYNDENACATDTLARITSMQSAGITAGYFFCYRDGQFGVPADTFALVLASGAPRCVRGTILNTPGQHIFNRFAL